jgi:hypothetical protein
VFDWSRPIPQNVAVEIISWGDPGKKRKPIAIDNEKQKTEKETGV